MSKAIILCSGGLDSVVNSYYIKNKLRYRDIIILFFNYSQKSLNSERKCSKKAARKLGAKFIEIKLDWLRSISQSLINKEGKIKKISLKDLKDARKESSKYYVPCRNLIFISHALALADSIYHKESKKSEIFLGFKCEGNDSYPDTTKEFVKKVNELSKISCLARSKIISPLIDMDKEDIIELGEKIGVNFNDTFSCYVSADKHCGVCLACRLRQEGFYWSNVKDPTKYRRKMRDFRSD